MYAQHSKLGSASIFRGRNTCHRSQQHFPSRLRLGNRDRNQVNRKHIAVGMLVKHRPFVYAAHAPRTRRRDAVQLSQVGKGQSCKHRTRSLCVTAAKSVTLNFQTSEGTTTIGCESGDILRDVMLEEKVDLYTTWGKIWTCGGNGQCGTCVVQVLDGHSLLSDKNETEEKKLKRKPDSYRLACQTNVGDGKNTGTVSVKTKPS